MSFSIVHNGLVACAVAELKVGSLMKVPKIVRTYLPEACTKPPLRNCHVLEVGTLSGFVLTLTTDNDDIKYFYSNIAALPPFKKSISIQRPLIMRIL